VTSGFTWPLKRASPGEEIRSAGVCLPAQPATISPQNKAPGHENLMRGQANARGAEYKGAEVPAVIAGRPAVN
jgi:hypothetical protein